MALVSPTRTTDTAAEPLLSFELTTNPDPLKASPENPSVPEEKGELIIVGARRHRDPADVQSIKVKVPAGTMAPDLAANLSAVVARISLDGWSTQLNEATDEFVFTPVADHETIGPDSGLTIQLSQIPINRKVGTSPITVTERSRTGNSAFQNRSTTFDIGKFPADFYLRNLVANPLVIDNGGQTTLTWERSTNAAYELLYGGTSLNVTNETTRTITNITADTTFYLRGSTGDPADPVVRVLTIQVTVPQPDLEVRNLIINGAITTTQGRVTVDAPVTITGALRADNSLTLTGALHATGDVFVTEGRILRVGDKHVIKSDDRIWLTNTKSSGRLIDSAIPYGNGNAYALSGNSPLERAFWQVEKVPFTAAEKTAGDWGESDRAVDESSTTAVPDDAGDSDGACP